MEPMSINTDIDRCLFCVFKLMRISVFGSDVCIDWKELDGSIGNTKMHV